MFINSFYHFDTLPDNLWYANLQTSQLTDWSTPGYHGQQQLQQACEYFLKFCV